MPLNFLRELNRCRLAARRELAVTRNYASEAERFTVANGGLAISPLQKPIPSFCHSGHAGDLIYALPAARALASDAPFKLYLKAGVDSNGLVDHPMGSVRLNDAMVASLLPLLNIQPYIAKAARLGDEPIDIVLDAFRDAPLDTTRGNIARWYCSTFCVALDLSQPWLTVDPLPGLEDTLVLARSGRYRNPALDFQFLNRYRRIVFVGLESEFNDMRASVKSMDYIQTEDYLKLARIIKGCKAFIGNQSSPYALAEALKVPRVLEVFHRLPNVIPEGKKAFEAWMQPQFEQAVRLSMAD